MPAQIPNAQVPYGVYTAANCTDCNDCLNSAAALYDAAGNNLLGLLERPLWAIRFRALGNRYAQLKKKEIAAGTFGNVRLAYEVEQFEQKFNDLAAIEGKSLPLPLPVGDAKVDALTAALAVGKEERISKAAALTAGNITERAERAVGLLEEVSDNAYTHNPESVTIYAARLGGNLTTALRCFMELSVYSPKYTASLCELGRFMIEAGKVIERAGYGYILNKEAANRLTISIEYASAMCRTGGNRPGADLTPPAGIVRLSQEDNEIWSGRSADCPESFIWEDYIMRRKGTQWEAGRESTPADFTKMPVAVPYSI